MDADTSPGEDTVRIFPKSTRRPLDAMRATKASSHCVMPRLLVRVAIELIEGGFSSGGWASAMRFFRGVLVRRATRWREPHVKEHALDVTLSPVYAVGGVCVYDFMGDILATPELSVYADSEPRLIVSSVVVNAQ